MKLYNEKTNKIVNIKFIESNGVHYVNKISEQELNALGYYKLEYAFRGNRRYYSSEETAGIVGNTYITGYTITELPLDIVKAKMLKDFFEAADSKEDSIIVSTTLGITVKGNSPALQAFTLGAKRGATTVRDENYQKHTVTVPQMNTLLNELEDNAVAFFDTKGDKFDELMLLPDVASCILYENTPYDYVVTEEDVLADFEGTLTVGDIITKYKNRVKEW